VCVEARPGCATSVTFRAWHRTCASLAISGLGRACSATRAGTGRTERSLARATAEQRRQDCGPARGSQTTLSTRTNLRMCSFRTSLRCAAQPTLGLHSAQLLLLWRVPGGSSRRLLIGCYGGKCNRGHSSILRRLIGVTSWFEPLILRLCLDPARPRPRRVADLTAHAAARRWRVSSPRSRCGRRFARGDAPRCHDYGYCHGYASRSSDCYPLW
jgi:hypothetical protein